MNDSIDLTKILKDCPEGTKLYSPIFGEVDFKEIRSEDENAIIITKGYVTASFTKEGFYYAYADVECLLFPSKDQRDWSKFTAPWLKKERFDPKTLKPFDRVVVRGTKISEWICGLFSHIIKSDNYDFYICIGSGDYKYCIPYNDNTKHLVGTAEEAPDFYKYWED